MRQALVYIKGIPAARLVELGPAGTANAYELTYLPEYATRRDACPVSQLLPVRRTPYRSPHLFAYFESMLPEGWHADMLSRGLHLDPADRFGLLLALAGQDAVGDVAVREVAS